MKVGVIGLGLIGGSILQRLAGHEVIGFDLDGAERPGVELAGSAAAVAERSELVVVAVPPAQTAAVVSEALAGNPDVLVTDVASVKAPVLEEVRRRTPGQLQRFLPSHPLAGSETGGWEAARPDLLDGAVWAVCPPAADAPAELLCRFGAVFESFDARIVVCDAAEHDLAVARTSHAPHLLAVALAAGLSDPLAAALSGGAFRDMTRVARSDRTLWAQILDLNRESVGRALDELVAQLPDGASPESWSRARSAVELVEQLRWREPEWEERSFEWPAWDELIDLGREGIALRRPALAGGTLTAQLTGRA